jgi:hypothetical protein
MTTHGILVMEMYHHENLAQFDQSILVPYLLEDQKSSNLLLWLGLSSTVADSMVLDAPQA